MDCRTFSLISTKCSARAKQKSYPETNAVLRESGGSRWRFFEDGGWLRNDVGLDERSTKTLSILGICSGSSDALELDDNLADSPRFDECVGGGYFGRWKSPIVHKGL